MNRVNKPLRSLMPLSNDNSLLPKSRLEHDLKVTLGSKIIHSSSQLHQQHPRIYQDILNDYQTSSPLPESALYWQQLLLSDSSICSELVLTHQHKITYIHYLNLLPADFGLFAPLWPVQTMNYINALIAETLQNIAKSAQVRGSYVLATTLINPNLVSVFKAHHFKQSPSGPMIIGLPLPARFFRILKPESR